MIHFLQIIFINFILSVSTKNFGWWGPEENIVPPQGEVCPHPLGLPKGPEYLALPIGLSSQWGYLTLAVVNRLEDHTSAPLMH